MGCAAQHLGRYDILIYHFYLLHSPTLLLRVRKKKKSNKRVMRENNEEKEDKEDVEDKEDIEEKEI
jgi:hypothetical protein